MTDIAKLGIKVESTGAEKATKDLSALTKQAAEAEKSAASLGKEAKEASVKIDGLGKEAKETASDVDLLDRKSKTLTGGLGGIGKSAGQASIQIQQFVGQVTSGTSATTALSQQAADLGIVMGAPLVGAVVGIGAALVGTLIPALAGAEDQTKGLTDENLNLIESYDDLTAAQKRYAKSIADIEIDRLTSQLSAAKNQAQGLQQQLSAPIGFSQDVLKAKSNELLKLQSDIDSYQTQIDDLTKATDNTTGASERFIEGLKEQADTMGKSTSQLVMYRAEALGIQGAELELVKALAKEIQAFEDSNKVKNKSTKASNSATESAKKLIESYKEQTIRLRDGRAAAIRYEASIRAAKAPTKELADEILRHGEALALQVEASEQSKEATKELAQANRDAEREYKRAFDTLTDGIADAIVNFKSLGDVASSVIKMIVQNAIKSNLGRALSAGGTMGASSAAFGADASPLGVVSDVFSIMNAGGSGAQSLFSSFAMSSAGQALGLSTQLTGAQMASQFGLTTGVAGGGTALTGVGSALQTGAGFLPWAAVGSLGANLLGIKGSGNPIIDTALSAGGGMAGGALGAKLGSIGGPVGAIAGAVLGTALSGLFGKKPSDKLQTAALNLSGEGGVTLGGFTGNKFSQENRDASIAFAEGVQSVSAALSALTGKEVDKAVSVFVGSRDGLRLMVDGAEAVKATNADVFFTQVTEKIVELYGEESASFATLATEGEKLQETLIRAANQLVTVDSVFSGFGLSLKDMTGNALEASNAMSIAAGSAEAFAAGATVFYNDFFTLEEKVAHSTQRLTEAFSELDMTIPTTRQEFRAIVDALDLTTASGQQALGALMALTPAVSQYIASLEQLNTSAGSFAQMAKSAFGVLSDVVGAEIDRINDSFEGRISDANDAIKKTGATLQILTNAVDRLVLSSDSMLGVRRAGAQALIRNALGGASVSDADLSRALGVIAEPSEDLFATFEDYARDFVKTATDIKGLEDKTATQLSIEQQMLESLEQQRADQISAMTELLDNARMQLNAMLGIEENTAILAGALAKFNFAVNAQAGAAITNQEISGFIQGATAGDAFNPGNITQDEAFAIYNKAAESGVSLSRIDSAMGFASGTAEEWAKRNGLPTFANGGVHSGGVRLVGENGPELELTGSSRIMSNSNTSIVFGAMAEEIKQLKDMMASALVAVAKNTRESADQLRRWDGDGLPEGRGY